ncbi:MAG: aminopeptidase P family protein [Vicingaceae bacterium]
MKNSLLTTLLLFFCGILLGQSDSTVVNKSEVLQAGLSPGFHKERRTELLSKLPARSIALIFSSGEKVRSNDVFYPFHQDPNFYYLTGLEEPDALLILFKEGIEIEGDTITELLFLPPSSKEYEKWNGARLGTYGAVHKLGMEKAMVNSRFADLFLQYDYYDNIYYSLPDGTFHDRSGDRGDAASMLKHFLLKTDSLTSRLNDVKLSGLLASMRQVKKQEELLLMQKAIDITCEAQRQLMLQLDPSFTEYQAEALIEFVFRSSGSEFPGFPSIVGGGANSCTLHYISNSADLDSNDLLVVDIGAEYRNYTADVTRTMPVSGKFSKEQRDIYDLVLRAQQAGISKCRKGMKFWDPNEAAVEVIQKGLKSLGITRRVYDAKIYFPHGTSHYLGLDVHDAGTYESLKPGHVITVEPGIYIPEGSDCDPKWWNIGVRIEDDVLITDGDPIVLSSCIPSSADSIEKIMESNH